MRIVAALAALAILLTACGASAGANDAETKFNSDVDEQGIASSLVQTGTDNLGTDVCNDIRSGQAAANVVINVQSGNANGLTMRGAEIITYYAITDICPDEISQRQDHWKTGT
jgi:hypothetical protein